MLHCISHGSAAPVVDVGAGCALVLSVLSRPLDNEGMAERRETLKTGALRAPRAMTLPARLAALHRGIAMAWTMTGTGPRFRISAPSSASPRSRSSQGPHWRHGGIWNIPSVSQLLAGGRSTPERSPGAARDEACEAPPRAPHRPKTRISLVPATGIGSASPAPTPGPSRHHDASRRRPSSGRDGAFLD